MSDGEIKAKCQECGREIPASKPCPYCGGTRKKYIATFSDKIGIKVDITEKGYPTVRVDNKWIKFPLYLLLIISAIIAFKDAIITKQAWYQDIFFWLPIVIVYVLVLCIAILGQIEITLKKIDQPLIKFNWKSLDDWIRVIKPGFTILLFNLISLYIFLNIAGQIKSQLNIDFVLLSSALGGLVLAAATFSQKNWADQLMRVAKLFIYAVFFLIIFMLIFSILSAVNFDATKPQCDANWIISSSLYILCFGSMLGGVFTFSKALTDLIEVMLIK